MIKDTQLNVGLDVKGREGTLSEFYESKGGPEAYLGTTTPGFPNYFLLMGANSATGHASIIFSEEVQVRVLFMLSSLREASDTDGRTII